MATQFCQTEKNFLTIIKVICDKIMLKNGPFLKEGIEPAVVFVAYAGIEGQQVTVPIK